jgi:hypothetical protein
LLVEHAEIFWSLFAVDMDAVLESQPPDTWDSFPLFQLLNDYLRNDGRFYEILVKLLAIFLEGILLYCQLWGTEADLGTTAQFVASTDLKNLMLSLNTKKNLKVCILMKCTLR